MSKKPMAKMKVTKEIRVKTQRVPVGDSEQLGLAVMEQCTDETAPLMLSISASLPLDALHYLFHEVGTSEVGVLVLVQGTCSVQFRHFFNKLSSEQPLLPLSHPAQYSEMTLNPVHATILGIVYLSYSVNPANLKKGN